MMHLKISYLSDDVSVLFMFTVRTFIITRDECIIFLRSVSDAYWFGDYTYIYIYYAKWKISIMGITDAIDIIIYV